MKNKNKIIVVAALSVCLLFLLSVTVQGILPSQYSIATTIKTNDTFNINVYDTNAPTGYKTRNITFGGFLVSLGNVLTNGGITNIVYEITTNVSVTNISATITNTSYITNTATAGFGLTNVTNQFSIKYFASTNFSIPTTDTNITTPHSLGATPRFVNPVIVCVTNDLGYTVNDEVSFQSIVSSGTDSVVANVAANPTNVIFVAGNGSANWAVWNRTNPVAGRVSITKTKWRLKFYANP